MDFVASLVGVKHHGYLHIFFEMMLIVFQQKFQNKLTKSRHVTREFETKIKGYEIDISNNLLILL